MHILIAVHGFPPTQTAGAERQAERMARWFFDKGHQVEVFTIESTNVPGFQVSTGEQDGLIVHRIYYDIRAGEDPFRLSYDNPQIGAALRKILTNHPFDIVHLISGYLLGSQIISTAKSMNIPVVVSPMEFWFLCPRLNLLQPSGALCTGPETDHKCMRCLMEEKRRFRIPAQVAPGLMDVFWRAARHMPFAKRVSSAVGQRRRHLQRALNHADLAIYNSRFLNEQYQRYGFSAQKFHFIRQGLTTLIDRIPPDKTTSGALRLGYIGQLKEHKGIDLLIDAVISLLDAGEKVQLSLWGDETEAPEYVQKLQARSLPYSAISWNGRYVGEQVWDVITSFDVLVVPSRWYENSPNVILEAFEMRRPVIVTDLGGMAELVEHEKSGLVFRLDSVDDLRFQIRRLLTEDGLLEQLRQGIPTVKRLDEEMQKILEQYENLVNQPQVSQIA